MLFTLKLYPNTIWGKHFIGNFNLILNHLQQLRIRSIIVPVFQGSRLFFPVEGGSENGEWDLTKFQHQCHDHNIAFIPEFPVFHDPDTFDTIPQYRPVNLRGKAEFPSSWYKPICPSNEPYRNYRIQLIRDAIKTFDPLLVSLEFLHYPYLPEIQAFDKDGTALPNYCYCDFCRYQFLDYSGKPNPLDAIDDWFQFRAENVTLIPILIAEEFEKTGKNGNMLVQIPPITPPQVLEKLRRSTGQYLKQWSGLVEVISPQFHLFQFDISLQWIESMMSEFKQLQKVRVIPEIDLPAKATPEDLKRLEEALNYFVEQQCDVVSLFHAEPLFNQKLVQKILEKFAE
ncbi:MAG: hypothetical protein Q9P90_00440 [candidate division KSB1 bacterium]|nr:hypothetical protein [candidate division KSB1 bacterium]